MKIKRLLVLLCCLVAGVSLLLTNGSSAVQAKGLGAQQLSITTTSDIQIGQIHGTSPWESSVAASPSVSTKAKSFSCDPQQTDVRTYGGGTVSYCKQKDFAITDNDSARIDIKPGAARAPHWHDTWEQQILLSGKAKTSIIDNKGKVYDEVLSPGMVTFIPSGATHWSEAIGDQTASFLLVFPAGFHTFSLGDSIAHVDSDLLNAVIGTPLKKIKLNRDDILMVE